MRMVLRMDGSTDVIQKYELDNLYELSTTDVRQLTNLDHLGI